MPVWGRCSTSVRAIRRSHHGEHGARCGLRRQEKPGGRARTLARYSRARQRGSARALPCAFSSGARALERKNERELTPPPKLPRQRARSCARPETLAADCVRHARAVAAPDDADAGAAPAADPNVGDTLDVLKISHGALRIELTTIDVTFLKVLLAVVRPRTETSSPSWSIDNTSAVKAIHLIVSAALLDTRALQFSHIGSALSTWRSTSS